MGKADLINFIFIDRSFATVAKIDVISQKGVIIPIKSGYFTINA